MLVFLIILLLLLIYKWLTRNHDYFKEIGIPYDKPKIFVGNIYPLFTQKESYFDVITKGYNKYKKFKVYGFFNLMKTSYVITDPEIIKTIAIKDFDHFVNRSEIFEADEILMRSLFALTDKKWRDMRTTLSPIFTSSKMKMMFGLLNDQSNDFIKFMHGQVETGGNLNVDVSDLFSRYTADAISTALLGFVGDSVQNTDSDVTRILKKFDSDFNGKIGTLKFMFSSLLPEIAQKLKLNVISKEVGDFFKKTVIDVMNERERKNISRPDVIQLLLQARKGQLKDKESDPLDKDLTNYTAHTEYDVSDKSGKMTKFEDLDWRAQGLIFFGAGFDTSRDLIVMTVSELAQNQDIQQTLFEEIEDLLNNLNGNPISYEALHKMKFLDMVVSESLRKWPPGPVIDRKCTRDYKLNLGNGKTIIIRKNQIVIFASYSIQRDPEYFEDPEKYDPYRFSNERKDSIIPETTLPFGSGPRACIGSRFALMSVKMILFKLFSEFKVENCEKTPKVLTIRPAFSLKFNETIYLNFIARKK